MADRLGPDRWAKPIVPGDPVPVPQYKPEDVAFPKQDQGRKDDSGKAPWHLFPWESAAQIVEVLRFGAGKYGERNWETGIAYSRVYSALIRHMTAWWQRAPGDTETGLSHLAHAGCCLVFLLAYEARGMSRFDDRPGATPGDAVAMVEQLKRMFETDTIMPSDFDALRDAIEADIRRKRGEK